jgi:hypothetical protein
LSYRWIRKEEKDAGQTTAKEQDPDRSSFELLDLGSEPYSEYGSGSRSMCEIYTIILRRKKINEKFT